MHQVGKIRQITTTLLDRDRIRKGELAPRAQEYLSTFLEYLMKLERSYRPQQAAEIPTTPWMDPAPSNSASPTNSDEEQLRQWERFRDYQLRYIEVGVPGIGVGDAMGDLMD
jgi:hypothetical protein